ncbi:envelope protein UL20 [Canid alphaherpesvirus 1]|uniref:Envelope protein UL20 n=1 Tax=Canid alphaherpesvirus 1 TaxID=170325 RepID=A0A172DSC4_9ALPH|nr:envelope protein UL20 [Canid alphaherpesvirus 1]ALL25915.1 envelope protein UL20 [Canid alphaherpesvirus 1]ALL25996.1 envelope protein UL20 [Canid alphaherpesvirus 1]ALL26071.1 envelope protein UL20 [Canid alphaherpesvirus 1]AQX83353.1 envelope protein UL20 [Canid alphaherpesvirus 1]ARE29844.1 envelope protein UL20 [Canid alphaherpesvirus 1]
MDNNHRNNGGETSIKLNNINEIETEEDIYNYISMSSYGGDTDFLVSSAYIVPKTTNQPVFTIYVIFFIISAFVIKPLCCLLFFNYYRATGISDFIIIGGVITLVYYGRLILMICFIYLNIKVDRLPLLSWQQFLIGLIVLGRTIAFIVIFHSAIFVDSELFFRVSAPVTDSDYITPLIAHKIIPLLSIKVVAFLLIISSAIYTADAICDAIGFIAPRLWVCILMRSYLSF